MRLRSALAIASTLSLFLPASTLAQGGADAFAAKPVVVIAPYEPGGPIDIEARMYTKKAFELTGQQYIIEYKTGASTRIGVGYVAKAAPDGHTLLLTNTSITIFPVLYKNLPFDPIKDLIPLSQMSKKTNVFLAHPAFPPRTFRDYIDYARANPGKVNYGMLGAGSSSHLAGAWLESLTNTKVNYIPYKGTAPEIVDLTAGRIDVTTSALIAVLPMIRTGKIRALAIVTDTRSGVLPDVPLASEMGVPEFVDSNWSGFFAPRGTPAPIISRLNELFTRVARSPDVISAADALGNIMVGSTPAQFAKLVIDDTVRWQKLVKDRGIVLEE